MFKKIIIWFFIFLLSIVLAEQVWRFYLFGFNSFSYKKLQGVVPFVYNGMVKVADDPNMRYELIPNASGSFKMTDVNVNSDGLRDKEYQKKKPNNTFRIAIIGDSYSFPSGVAIEDAWHSKTEEVLNSSGHKNYELINFAVGGYALPHYLSVIERKVSNWDVDAIIIGFCPQNDFIIPKWKADDSFKVPFRMNGFKKSYINEQIKTYQRSKAFSKRDVNLSDAQKKELTNYFLKIKGAVKNIPILIFYLDNRVQNPDVVKDISEQVGFYFLDVTKEFKDKDLMSYSIYAIDSHPNAKANAIFSKQLTEYIQELKW